jgi:hypothetical protein
MSISSWLSWPLSRSQARRGQRRDSVSHSKKARLFLEHLEGRALLTNYSAASVSALIADINAANTAGGANTITLTAKTTSPYVLTSVNNSTYSGYDANGLPVIAGNDNLTIVGKGDTIKRSTASGTPYFRLLDVASGGSLTLENLTLQGGDCWVVGVPPAFGGGAIYNDGTLVLNGVTVQKNYAESAESGGSGGGIYSVGGSVTLEGGTIVSFNGAGCLGFYYAGAYSAGWGGGLYAQNSAVTVTNATLDNNYAGAAQGCGGGLYAFNSTVTVTNSTLDNNTVSGALNQPRAAGGGLYAFGSTVAVTNSTLDNNSTRGVNCGFGGGLYVGSGTATLSNDTVKSNRAAFGGGLYADGATVTVTNAALDNNSAFGYSGYGGGSGGGLYVGSGTATLSNDTVESNTAKGGYGGGLYVGCATVTLANDTVESNTAIGGYGGGIFVYQCQWATVYLDSFTVANTINNTDSSGLNESTANIDGTYILTP